MRELLALHGVTAVSAAELNLAEPEESGSSFAANARIKAEAAANGSGEGAPAGLKQESAGAEVKNPS